MKARLSVVAIALSTFAAGHALASDPAIGKTREQVRAELNEAMRSGDLIVNGETGQRANELAPHLYTKPVTVEKTRAEVKAELTDAIRTGDLVADGETGTKFNQVFPNRYPQPVMAQGNVRNDVRADAVNSRSSNGS